MVWNGDRSVQNDTQHKSASNTHKSLSGNVTLPVMSWTSFSYKLPARNRPLTPRCC